MQTLRKLRRCNDGSTLVGAVVISVVLAIAAAGLMGASRNTVSHEVGSLDDARAFLAAESGLLILSSWATTAGPGAMAGDTTIEIDNINVTLSVTPAPSPGLGAPPPPNQWILASTALLNAIPYSKTLGWGVDVQGTDGLATGAYSTILTNPNNPLGPGFTDINFNGPVHFNMPINPPYPGVSFNNGYTMYNEANGTGKFLGIEFIDINSPIPDIAVHTLPANATLTFGVASNGQPYYTVNGTSIHYNRDDNIILRGMGTLNVTGGAMLGKVTVVTPNGFDIRINLNNSGGNGNHLTYHWANNFPNGSFDASNQGKLSPTGVSYFEEQARGKEDVLAFYSGRNINMTVSNSSNGHVLAAQLFAVNENSTILGVSSNQRALSVIGTIAVDKFWYDERGNFNNMPVLRNIYNDPRNLPAVGVGLVDAQGNPIAGGGITLNILPGRGWNEVNTPITH